MNLELRTLNNFKQGNVIKFSVVNDNLCEIADEYGNVINNVLLNTYSIEHRNSLNIETSENTLLDDMEIYPNHVGDFVNIKYHIINEGNVKI